jgi:uncharacterized protein YgfB (UPF0149 family)
MLAATYDDFERVLRDARALPDPAEAHGTLAGALCSSRDYGLIEWLREILPDDSPDEAALQSSVLQNVYDAMVRQLGGNDADFQPLLPEDDVPLSERADALSAWCQGFLYGLGSGTTADPAKVSAEAEFVRVGVQLLFVELAPARGQEPDPVGTSIH